MPATLANTTTTANLRDTQLGGGTVFGSGTILIANNPVQIQITTGIAIGQGKDTLYPYVTPTTLPLVSTPKDRLIAVQFADAVTGAHAQVSGWLLEPDLAGIGVGNAFTQTVAAGGQITNPSTALTPLFDSTLTVAAANFNATGLVASFTNLLILLTARGDTAAADVLVKCQLNGDGGANYSDQTTRENAAALTTQENAVGLTSMTLGSVPAATGPANASGSLELWIPNYAGTVFQKAVNAWGSFRNTATAAGMFNTHAGGAWNNTSAVSQVTIFPVAGNFIAGSRLTIFGF